MQHSSPPIKTQEIKPELKKEEPVLLCTIKGKDFKPNRFYPVPGYKSETYFAVADMEDEEKKTYVPQPKNPWILIIDITTGKIVTFIPKIKNNNDVRDIFALSDSQFLCRSNDTYLVWNTVTRTFIHFNTNFNNVSGFDDRIYLNDPFFLLQLKPYHNKEILFELHTKNRILKKSSFLDTMRRRPLSEWSKTQLLPIQPDKFAIIEYGDFASGYYKIDLYQIDHNKIKLISESKPHNYQDQMLRAASFNAENQRILLYFEHPGYKNTPLLDHRLTVEEVDLDGNILAKKTLDMQPVFSELDIQQRYFTPITDQRHLRILVYTVQKIYPDGRMNLNNTECLFDLKTHTYVSINSKETNRIVNTGHILNFSESGELNISLPRTMLDDPQQQLTVVAESIPRLNKSLVNIIMNYIHHPMTIDIPEGFSKFSIFAKPERAREKAQDHKAYRVMTQRQ